MKKVVVSLVSFSFAAFAHAQTVFTYGKISVSKTEFVKAFNKNPGQEQNRAKALKNYLDLYANFKLKVAAAYAEGVDKEATQLFELENFKRQIAGNLINDEANVKALVKEAFVRSQKDIHLAQILIEIPAGGDTVSAYKRIQQAYTSLKEGKDFVTVLQGFTTDEATRQTNGDLGYISAFTLPYEFETIAYALKPNSFSAPVKSKIGYHIFKNLGERQSQGSRRIAQILIALPQNGSIADKTSAIKKADSVYTLLQKGADFETLAATVSNDVSSNNNKGEIPEFTAGTYSADFENVAFSLNKPGELSKPFQTSYGVHILKLLEATPAVTDVNDAAANALLYEKVIRDNRMNLARKQFIEKKLATIKYKTGTFKESDILLFTDSVINKPDIPTFRGINEKTVIFSFAKQNFTAADWIRFARIAPQLPDYKAYTGFSALYKEYIYATAEEYYKKNLALYNAEFAAQVKEFKEANMLFSIMERKIWGKANTDTAALLHYYHQNKSKYSWSASADAVIISCSNKQTAEELQERLTGNLKAWRAITDSFGSDVTADSSRYELGQLPVIDRTNFTPGLLTAPVKNEAGDRYTFNYVINVYRNAEPRSFEDARGLVISDYQQELEKRWIEELKKKYPVKINEVVFRSIK